MTGTLMLLVACALPPPTSARGPGQERLRLALTVTPRWRGYCQSRSTKRHNRGAPSPPPPDGPPTPFPRSTCDRRLAGVLSEQEHQMTQRGDPKSSRAGRSGDDFRKIDGIGRVFEQRLWDAGIFTYSDLARRTPEEIAAVLAPMAGISPEHIA